MVKSPTKIWHCKPSKTGTVHAASFESELKLLFLWFAYLCQSFHDFCLNSGFWGWLSIEIIIASLVYVSITWGHSSLNSSDFIGILQVLKVEFSMFRVLKIFNFHPYIWQGCGNTLPDLSDLVLFHSGQVRNFYLLVLWQVKMNLQFCISFLVIIMNSHVMEKTVWILISWLLKKPADLDLHCFNILCMVSYCFKAVYMHSDGFALSVLLYGKVKLIMDKSTLLQFTCPWASINFLLFSHLCMFSYFCFQLQ